jgi:hypothetical protein
VAQAIGCGGCFFYPVPPTARIFASRKDSHWYCAVFGLPLMSRAVERRGEMEFFLQGSTATGQLVVVVHTERGDNIRTISARPATRAERRDDEAG